MHILVVGATGGCGEMLIREALIAKHTVVVLARNPQKLPEDLKYNDRVEIVNGDLMDQNTMEKVLEGVDAVVSALGPAVLHGPFHSRDTPIAKIYKVIVDSMKNKGVKRLIALSTASVPAPEDKSDFKHSVSVFTVSTFAQSAYKDIVASGKIVSEANDLEWTLARVPILLDDTELEHKAGFLGDHSTGMFLNRAAFANFVIKELHKNEWVHRIPMITNA